MQYIVEQTLTNSLEHMYSYLAISKILAISEKKNQNRIITS